MNALNERFYCPSYCILCKEWFFEKPNNICIFIIFSHYWSWQKYVKNIIIFPFKFFDYRSDQQPPNPSDLIPNYNPISIVIRRFTLCPAVIWPNISFICHQQTTVIKLKLHVPRFYISFQILRVFQRMALIAHGEFLSMSGDVYTFLLITCSLNYQIHGKAGRLTRRTQINIAAPENFPNRRVNY